MSGSAEETTSPAQSSAVPARQLRLVQRQPTSAELRPGQLLTPTALGFYQFYRGKLRYFPVEEMALDLGAWFMAFAIVASAAIIVLGTALAYLLLVA